MTYVISYDLNNPGKNYDDLYNAIKNLGSTWCHPVDSTWYVVSTLSASNIRDQLKAVMDRNDALIVTKASVPGAWFGLSDNVNAWLQAHL